MAGMWIKNSIFIFKIPSIAPTLGGPGPPWPPPVPTPMRMMYCAMHNNAKLNDILARSQLDFLKGGCRVGVLVRGMHVHAPFQAKNKNRHKNLVKVLDKVE